MREYKAATLRSSTASSHSSQVVSETNDAEDGYDANIISNEPKATDGNSDEACIDSNSSEELTSSLTSSHENDANEAEVKQLRKDLRAAELYFGSHRRAGRAFLRHALCNPYRDR